MDWTVAPPSVADASSEAYRRLRDVRNAMGTRQLTVAAPGAQGDGGPGAAEWQAVHSAYNDGLHALRAAMRKDVGGRHSED